MPREWRLRIQDILECIAHVESYTHGLDYAAFASNTMLREAVERNFTIIGEAARHVPDEIASRHPEIPWDDLRGMRNIIVHEYFGVNLRIVWMTIQRNLPPLVGQLERLLEAER